MGILLFPQNIHVLHRLISILITTYIAGYNRPIFPAAADSKVRFFPPRPNWRLVTFSTGFCCSKLSHAAASNMGTCLTGPALSQSAVQRATAREKSSHGFTEICIDYNSPCSTLSSLLRDREREGKNQAGIPQRCQICSFAVFVLV